jgi:hypothetical protein
MINTVTYYQGDNIKEYEMVGTCRTHDGDDKKENEDCNPKLRPEVEV